MTTPSGPSAAGTARVLHLALMASAITFVAMGWYFRGRFLLPAGAAGAVGFAAYALAASGLLAGIALRRLLPERGASEPLDAWWRAQLPKAVAVWAIGEGTALFGALVLAVGAGLPAAILVILAGLGVLLANTPGRLVS